VVATVPRLDPSVAASLAAAPGGSGLADDAAVVLRATVEKEVVDAAAAKKAMDDVAVAERATADRKNHGCGYDEEGRR
jgi:hypothetical protein